MQYFQWIWIRYCNCEMQSSNCDRQNNFWPSRRRFVSIWFWKNYFKWFSKTVSITTTKNVKIHFLHFDESVDVLKVSKFQNENMKSSQHCPKYEQKKMKNSALSIQGRIFQIFVHILGNATTSYFHFEIYWPLVLLA